MADLLEAGDLGGNVHNLSLYRFPINKIINQSFVGIVDNQGQKPWYWLVRLPMTEFSSGFQVCSVVGERKDSEGMELKRGGGGIQDLKEKTGSRM